MLFAPSVQEMDVKKKDVCETLLPGVPISYEKLK
jgi:hypothetical protein